MSTNLFGYLDMGVRALGAAQIGLQVAGNNIANVNTPGYGRRRVDFEAGFPVRVPGGFLDSGVQVGQIRRVEDRFLQASFEREQGQLAGSREYLRGLQQIESLFGELDQDGISALYADFSDRFSELSGAPEDRARRRIAVSAAESLARGISDVASRLETQRRFESDKIEIRVDEINRLAESLARLNREIVTSEFGRGVAAPLRDERAQVVEKLAALTGGTAVPGDDGRLLFSIGRLGTLVSGDDTFEVSTTTDATGARRVLLDGRDVTDDLRSGEVGAVLAVRDDQIGARLADLDALAADLITRTNGILAGGSDLSGNPGIALFEPDPPGAGAAAAIRVSDALRADPTRLGVSASGAPGDGSLALAISEIRETASAALGGQAPAQFFADVVSSLGSAIAQADVALDVSQGIVENLQARRDTISGVSLDEEAVELVRHQRSYEAAARFISVMNELTEIAVSIGR